MSGAGVRIRFDLVWKAPKGRDVKVFVIGSITELGLLDLSSRDFWKKFQKSVQESFKDFQELVEKKRTAKRRKRPDTETKGTDTDSILSEDESSEDSSDSSADSLESDVLEEIGRAKDQSELLHFYLDRSFETMVCDPDETGVEDLWQSDAIKVTSCSFPARFSFAFVVWNVEDNRLWGYETFPTAREVKMPDLTRGGKNATWVYFAKQWESKKNEEELIVEMSGSGDEEGGEGSSSDDDAWVD